MDLGHDFHNYARYLAPHKVYKQVYNFIGVKIMSTETLYDYMNSFLFDTASSGVDCVGC